MTTAPYVAAVGSRPSRSFSQRLAVALAALEATGPLRRFGVRRGIKIALDAACGGIAIVVALLIDDHTAWAPAQLALLALGTALAPFLVHTVAGSYRSIWRYTGLTEVVVTAGSSLAAFVVLLLVGWLGIAPISVSIALLASLLMLLLCGGIRLLRRWQVAESRLLNPWRSAPASLAPHRLLIAGAGEHGLSIARDLLKGDLRNVALVGFLDDDPAKIGAAPYGLPVFGPLSQATEIASLHGVTEVIAAMPSTPPERIRAFGRRLEQAGIRVRALRGVEGFVLGRDVHTPGSARLKDLITPVPSAVLSDGNGSAPNPNGGEPRHILLTGGAGYVGSHLTRLLLDAGHHVRVLDRLDYGRAGLDAILGHPHLELLTGDICNTRDVSRAMRGVDSVLALAAIVGDPACNLDPEETVNLNYTATKVLIETANFYGVRRVVFASSCSVYGASSDDLLTEDSRLNPVSLYARTRVLSENILFDRRGDVEPVVLRLATVFGMSPRMRFDLVVNTLTARAVTDRKISIFGGNQWRPNVHCRDVARAFMMALKAPAPAVAGQVFNVGGDGNNHRIDDLGAMVASILGDVEVIREGDTSDPRDYRVSFAKIRRVLGFEPEFDVPAGIREVAAAVRRDPVLQDHRNSIFHNVQHLQRAFENPRRRHTDFPPARRLAQV